MVKIKKETKKADETADKPAKERTALDHFKKTRFICTQCLAKVKVLKVLEFPVDYSGHTVWIVAECHNTRRLIGLGSKSFHPHEIVWGRMSESHFPDIRTNAYDERDKISSYYRFLERQSSVLMAKIEMLKEAISLGCKKLYA